VKRKTHIASARQSQRGFALVVTLSMMLLLLVLGVGLLSLSVISLRGSSHGEARQIAQGNARLGLMLALAQLQKEAGDDFAVTATADIAAKADAVKGLVPPQPGSRYWTGVWTNAAAPANAASQIYSRTPVARPKGWLVSGGEDEPILPDHPKIALGANGEVGSSDEAVLLVGPGSAGPADAEAIKDYVSVPLVAIPGIGRAPGGRYGWWVGDEGVKTRYNMPSVDDDANPANGVTYASLGSRGGGWETVTGFSDYPSRGTGGEALLTRIFSVPAAALMDPTLVARDSALKRSFHSVTTDSRGLLTDNLNGGLRLDLTRYLEDGFPATPDLNIPNAPTLTTNIIPRIAARSINGPRWERMRSFNDLSKSVNDGTMTVKPAADANGLTIAPIITDMRILMGARIMAEGASTTNYRLLPTGKVAVSLANPYPHTLRWDRDLEVEIINVTPAGNAPSRIWDAAGQPAYIPRDTSEPAVFNNAIFTIPSGELEPGEAAAYTMRAPVSRPANTARITIPLAPFGSSSPANLENSIIMEHAGVNTASRLLDVRESWTTTLISVELRATGGGSRANALLRRIERLELDNAFFASVRRPVDGSMAQRMTRPFPLMLYSFQISQPGADYGQLLPSSTLLGTRNSTLRTFMDFNLQGVNISRPITAYNAPPYFMESSDSLATLPFNAPGGDTGNGFTRNLAISPLSWGRSPTGPKKTILFSPQEKLVSLAQFQHADLTADDTGPSVAHQPGYAVGNSYATPFVRRAVSSQARINYRVQGSPNMSGVLTEPRTYYDLSYLLNASLWDTFFLSTIPGTGDLEPLNTRLAEIQPGAGTDDLRSASLAASRLWIEGAFNVNSTRKDAWKALLAGNRNLKHPSESQTQESVMFPRSLSQPGEAILPKPSGINDDSFNGFRRLNDAQLDALAEELTRQVRLRGPFLTLSQFVNRALIDIDPRTDPDGLGRSGALQSAIDLSGLNMSPGRNDSGFSRIVPRADQVTMLANGNLPRGDMDGGRPSVFTPGDDWAPTSKDLNPGSIASILADRPMLTNARLRPEQGFRSTAIPGWLTQADVLQVIGPVLSVRSDTFRIRSYGEAHDGNGRPIARAWCEAIVQRVPDYLDPTDARAVRPADLNSVNARFGRRFEIISFRWLSPHEV